VNFAARAKFQNRLFVALRLTQNRTNRFSSYDVRHGSTVGEQKVCSFVAISQCFSSRIQHPAVTSLASARRTDPVCPSSVDLSDLPIETQQLSCNFVCVSLKHLYELLHRTKRTGEGVPPPWIQGNEELPSQPRELVQGKGGQLQRALVFKTSPHVLTPNLNSGSDLVLVCASQQMSRDN
jgi:hypothetical protein